MHILVHGYDFRAKISSVPGYSDDLVQLIFHILVVTFSFITFANKICPPWTESDPIFHRHHFIWCYFFICVNLGGIWMRFISPRRLSRVFIFLLSFLFRSYYRFCPSAVCRRSWAPLTCRTLHRGSLVQIYLSSWTWCTYPPSNMSQAFSCHGPSYIYIYIYPL